MYNMQTKKNENCNWVIYTCTLINIWQIEAVIIKKSFVEKSCAVRS